MNMTYFHPLSQSTSKTVAFVARALRLQDHYNYRLLLLQKLLQG